MPMLKSDVIMPLHKFMYAVRKNDKVNNWSQEIHVITHYIDFEHIKGKTMSFQIAFQRLKTLGLYEANNPKQPASEYGKLFLSQNQE